MESRLAYHKQRSMPAKGILNIINIYVGENDYPITYNTSLNLRELKTVRNAIFDFLYEHEKELMDKNLIDYPCLLMFDIIEGKKRECKTIRDIISIKVYRRLVTSGGYIQSWKDTLFGDNNFPEMMIAKKY